MVELSEAIVVRVINGGHEVLRVAGEEGTPVAITFPEAS